MGIDYYGVLSIQRNSNELEIRKAYRNLALEFNPERLQDDGTHKIFALIGEAYEVLSNPLLRAVFDQYGEEGLKRGVPGPGEYIPSYHYHGDPLRTYKEFFGTASPYADLLNYLKDPPSLYELPEVRGVRKKQPPIYHPLCLTLHEIYFGGVKKMKIRRLQFIGSDCILTELKENILSVPIKPGIKPETLIIFPEEGDQNPLHIPADVIFVTKEREHECFTRQNNDLIMRVEISLEEALLGTTVTVSTIDHRTLRVPITDVVSPSYEKVVENEGMPILENPENKGNLIIRFTISFPQYIPQSSKDVFQKAFHLVKIGGGFHHEMINKMILADKIMRIDPCEQLPPL
ncbi:hypothetical protein PPYR_08711 [Photinus pyralis]|uniref:J domain-containing protein n=2 Tax=Photinus pyralis TaxID=7054 RepID=A0A5N4AKH4_PHOPY|nr:dnaJ homolog subfamily B member 13-like [Photinus pyralis]KAB0797718.1 hypothetical protein PPYR_08711 [Photinus pyralis]